MVMEENIMKKITRRSFLAVCGAAAAAAAGAPGRVEAVDAGEVDDRRRERQGVGERAGRRAEPQLEGRVIDVGGRADEAVVDFSSHIHFWRPSREEHIGR